MAKSVKPLARQAGLRIQTVNEETLVYDDRTDKAYVLSPASAAIWRACNGERTVSEIAQYLSARTPTSDQVVWYALEQLNPLLDAPITAPQGISGLSRRQFLARTGLVAGAVAVPVVVSIIAPQAAHAQSVVGFCCSCLNSTQITLNNCLDCVPYCQLQGSDVAGCTTLAC